MSQTGDDSILEPPCPLPPPARTRNYGRHVGAIDKEHKTTLAPLRDEIWIYYYNVRTGLGYYRHVSLPPRLYAGEINFVASLHLLSIPYWLRTSIFLPLFFVVLAPPPPVLTPRRIPNPSIDQEEYELIPFRSAFVTVQFLWMCWKRGEWVGLVRGGGGGAK